MLSNEPPEDAEGGEAVCCDEDATGPSGAAGWYKQITQQLHKNTKILFIKSEMLINSLLIQFNMQSAISKPIEGTTIMIETHSIV